MIRFFNIKIHSNIQKYFFNLKLVSIRNLLDVIILLTFIKSTKKLDPSIMMRKPIKALYFQNL
jgi:hypothetical protein